MCVVSQIGSISTSTVYTAPFRTYRELPEVYFRSVLVTDTNHIQLRIKFIASLKDIFYTFCVCVCVLHCTSYINLRASIEFRSLLYLRRSRLCGMSLSFPIFLSLRFDICITFFLKMYRVFEIGHLVAMDVVSSLRETVPADAVTWLCIWFDYKSIFRTIFAFLLSSFNSD